jgi:hypothetical protein
MDQGLIDNLVLLFALVYYAFLVIVYLVRAHNLSDLELKLAPIFSIQLVPFGILWMLNILGGDTGRIISTTPIIVFHHPDKWPVGLIVYLILLFIGSIGLNWYGFLVSDFYGNVLVVSFFVMLGSFGYYQSSYRKRND